MKILAILTLRPEASMTAVRTQLTEELRGSWTLYTSGQLREVYATESQTRVVFILEAASAGAAADSLRGLPLVASGVFQIETLELRPFVNWSMLFAV